MTDPKQDMEEECRRLQENLRSLTEARALLKEEFSQLGDMYGRLVVQLKEDTLAGEGQLHAFHAEKRRTEARLEALEAEIALKDECLAQLDARASEYLLKVTTASNALEDEEEEEEDAEGNEESEEGQVRSLVQRLVLEDMAEHDELPGEANSSEEDTKREEHPEGEQEEGSDASSSSSIKINLEEGDPQENEDDEEITAGQVTPPTKAQMKSLSALVEELRRVKDEMGLCVSASKRSSVVELEGELQATREELAFLRGSMSDMRGSYQPSETGVDEKIDLLDLPLDDLPLDSQGSHGRSVSPGSLRGRSGVRSPSIGVVSRRVAQLEQEALESHERLAEAQRQVVVLTEERAKKERECIALQRKVTTVEGRAKELQSAFDALVSAVVKERDDLSKEADELRARVAVLENDGRRGSKDDLDAGVKAVEEKYRLQLEVCQGSLHELEASHARELERLKSDFRTTEGNLKARIEQLGEDLRKQGEKLLEAEKSVKEERRGRQDSATALEAERAKATLLQKEVEVERSRVESLTATVKKLEGEMADFAPSFKEEMDRLREETKAANRYKADLEKSLNELQAKENNDLDGLKEEKEKQRLKVVSLEAEKEELQSKMRVKEEEVDELRQKVVSLETEMEDLRSKMRLTEEENSEELRAREATIQELRLTLTNNQKQSRENYQMVEDEMAALQLRHSREKEEAQALLAHVKEKLLKAEDDVEKWQRKAEALQSEVVPKEESVEEHSSKEESTSTAEQDSNPKVTPGEVLKEGERQLSSNSEQISALESKVVDLESQLLQKTSRVDELEGELKKTAKQEDLKTRFEQQMAQIKELNDFVDDLKAKVESLKGESSDLRKTVERVEGEKDALAKELEEAKSTARELEEDAGTKKNLVEALGVSLGAFECSVLGSSDYDLAVVSSLSSRLESLQVRVENDLKKHLAKISEIEDAKETLTKQMAELEGLKEEEARNFDEERNRTLEMQNAMVSDLETLILGLEKDKKDLEAEVKRAKEELDAVEKERGILRQELAALKVTLNEKSESESVALIQDLTRRSEALESRLTEAQHALDEKESSFEERLRKERAAYEHRLDRLRRDLREEMDILEQQKDELRQEMKWEVERVAAEWAVRLEEGVAEQEARLLEEKAQFGRVLVAKNDAYERLREESRVEAAGYQARLCDLQEQLDEKAHLIDELEGNLEEIVAVRDNLEEKLALLKESLLTTSKTAADGGVPSHPSLTQLLNNPDLQPPSPSPIED